jgi:hypothetical protein
MKAYISGTIKENFNRSEFLLLHAKSLKNLVNFKQ